MLERALNAPQNSVLRIGVVAVSLGLAACASSPATTEETAVPTTEVVAPAPADRGADIWTPRPDGGVDHIQSGGVCPSPVRDWMFSGKVEFLDNGMDVACQYALPSPNNAATAYFTVIGDEDITAYGEQSALAVVDRFGFELDEEATLACRLMMGLVLASEEIEEAGRGDQIVVEANTAPCWVYSSEGFATLVAVRKFGPWAYKIRVSRTLSDDDEVLTLVEDLPSFMELQTGIPNSPTA